MPSTIQWVFKDEVKSWESFWTICSSSQGALKIDPSEPSDYLIVVPTRLRITTDKITTPAPSPLQQENSMTIDDNAVATWTDTPAITEYLYQDKMHALAATIGNL